MNDNFYPAGASASLYGPKPVTAHLGADAHLALTDHLVQSGMGAADAEHTLAAISPGLYDALSSHQYGDPSRLMFHTDGDVAVSIEPHGHADPTASLGMDTLYDLHVKGVPYEGLEAVRDGLGAEGAHMSDLALIDTFGHAVVEHIGETGYPYDTVRDVQQVLQQHVDVSGGFATVSRSEALQALVAASSASPDATLALNNGNGRDITVRMDALHSVLEAQPQLDAGVHAAVQADQARTLEH